MKRWIVVLLLLCVVCVASEPPHWLTEVYFKATPQQIKNVAGGTKDAVAAKILGDGSTYVDLTNACTIQVMLNLETTNVTWEGDVATTNVIAAGTETLVRLIFPDIATDHRMRLRTKRAAAEALWPNKIHVEYHLDSRDANNLLRSGTVFGRKWDAVDTPVPQLDLPPLGPYVDSFALASSNLSLGGIADDCSGCCIMPASSELLAVDNGNEDIYVYDQDGNYTGRKIDLTGFDDTEGICHIASNQFAVVEERIAEITIITLETNTTSFAKASGTSYNMNIADPGNSGIEGIAWDSERGVFYAVRERSPMAVYEVVCSNGVGYTTVLFDAAACIGHLTADISDLYYDVVWDQLLILAQDTATVIVCDRIGSVIKTHQVTGNQPEGVTMSLDKSMMHIVGEPEEWYGYVR